MVTINRETMANNPLVANKVLAIYHYKGIPKEPGSIGLVINVPASKPVIIVVYEDQQQKTEAKEHDG